MCLSGWRFEVCRIIILCGFSLRFVWIVLWDFFGVCGLKKLWIILMGCLMLRRCWVLVLRKCEMVVMVLVLLSVWWMVGV